MSGCRNCGEDGHYARECTQPEPRSVGGGGGRSFHSSGEEGHMSRDCPSKGSGGGGGGACRSSGQEGHYSRDCPTNSGGRGGGQITCRTCGKEGHMSRDCPSKPPGGNACRRCGEKEHFEKDCSQRGGGGDKSCGCMICKDVGHMARDCPSKPEDGGACHRCEAEGHFSKDCPDKKEGEGAVGPDGKPTERYTPANFAEGEDAFQERQNTHSGTGINFSAYANIPVTVTASGDNVPPPIDSFSKMELRDLIMTNLAKVGYTKPTPIQQDVYPILASKRDVMACAQTGSGKSCAFLLPIINELMSSQELSPPSTIPARPEALILAPTRELAVQIGKEGNLYAQNSMVKTRVIYGGTTSFAQRNQIHSGCNILVATPGRMLQFLNGGHVVLDKIVFFILDEADRMLDMGFMGDVQKIVEQLPPKEQRTSGMFSATFPQEIQDSAKDFLNNYIFVTVGIVGGACKDVEQVFEQVDRKEKRGRLIEILRGLDENEKVLVFCASQKGADLLATSLVIQGFSCTSIQGDRIQSQRETALREFACGTRQIQVSTAVAARGLDIPKVTTVINFDLPSEIDEYVHRIGRTGRVANSGRAISFFDQERDAGIMAALKNILNDAGQKLPDWMDVAVLGQDPVEPAPPAEREYTEEEIRQMYKSNNSRLTKKDKVNLNGMRLSPVWEFFDRLYLDGKLILFVGCSYCEHVEAYDPETTKGRTEELRRHIASQHKHEKKYKPCSCKKCK